MRIARKRNSQRNVYCRALIWPKFPIVVVAIWNWNAGLNHDGKVLIYDQEVFVFVNYSRKAADFSGNMFLCFFNASENICWNARDIDLNRER